MEVQVERLTVCFCNGSIFYYNNTMIRVSDDKSTITFVDEDSEELTVIELCNVLYYKIRTKQGETHDHGIF